MAGLGVCFGMRWLTITCPYRCGDLAGQSCQYALGERLPENSEVDPAIAQSSDQGVLLSKRMSAHMWLQHNRNEKEHMVPNPELAGDGLSQSADTFQEQDDVARSRSPLPSRASHRAMEAVRAMGRPTSTTFRNLRRLQPATIIMDDDNVTPVLVTPMVQMLDNNQLIGLIEIASKELLDRKQRLPVMITSQVLQSETSQAK